MLKLRKVRTVFVLVCAIYSSFALAQFCPYEPLGELKGETATCVLATYSFREGSTDQSLAASNWGPASSTFDGLSLFDEQVPQPSNISPPFGSGSSIVALGTPDSASGIRVEHRGRVAMKPRASGGEFTQTMAFESHARVTFTPFIPDSAGETTVSVIVDYLQKFRLTDDAAGGADTGQANGGATVLLRNASEASLADDISGSAFLNMDTGEDPNLWNDFEKGGTSVSCGDACRDITVILQRTAEVPTNQPISLDAYTYGLADNYGQDTGSTVYSNDNQDTAIVKISSANPAVRFNVAGDLPALAINAGMNDAWYNPATAGQGLLISVFPNSKQMFVAWFTYDVERPPEDVTAMLGEPGHRWLTAQGPFEGNTANLTIYLTEGGVFDSAVPEATTNPAGDGTMTVTFPDCSAGIISYEIASLSLSGEIPIQRIVPDNVPLCESLANP